MLAPIQNLIRRAADTIGGNRRRGTVLLLVLGSLALVLILAVVYAALGKGDRRTARQTIVRKDAVANVEGVGRHILDVIGRDVFNLVPEITDSSVLRLLGTDTPIMRRETVDMPVTDAFFTSVPDEINGVNGNQNLAELMRFRPDGGHNADLIWDEFTSDITEFGQFNVDPRTASDPFLASTRPVDLGANNLPLDTPPYLRHLDWAQISNFAPDGRFVNLYYLRSDAQSAGFAAPSIDLTRDPNSNRARLTLLDRDGEPTEYLPYTDMVSSGGTVGGRRDRADWNKPFHWTMNQRRLFRPVNDPAFASSLLGDPGSPEYWAYQYADADGDGILDSRWIELVDYTNPVRPVSVLGDTEMRFFIAARAIDLSSLVNVATATDFLTPPTMANRLGAGPQDMSIFKLLNFSEHTLVHALPQDINTNGGINYNDAFETGTGQTGDYGSWSLPIAQAMGRKSYLRLIDGSARGSIQPYQTVPGEVNATRALSNDLRDYTINESAEDRNDYARAVGSVYPGVTAGGNSRTAPYTVDDLVELLTFHGINDDRNFSKLEQAFSAANSDNIPLTSFSQLRSDRKTTEDAWVPTGQNVYDLKLMRSAVDIRRMLTTVSGSRPLRSSILDQADYAQLSDSIDRKVLLDALVLSDGGYPTAAINPADNIEDINDQQSRLIANAFGVYLDLLAPELKQLDWDRTDLDQFDSFSTQYYGHMGPELATRLAGHMALNFRDMADAPYVIDPATGLPDATLVPSSPNRFNIMNLDLSDANHLAAYNRRTDEPSVAAMRLSESWDPATPGIMKDLWDAGLKLDIDQVLGAQPGQSFIAADAPSVSHEAMILYGVEPQPFLSQVSSMVMYTDIPKGIADNLNGNADGEWQVSNGGIGPDGIGGNGDDFDGLPNIDGDVTAANEDFIFQALFFQLFNPFDVPIVLDRYYIEYADSFYSFTNGGAGLPVILQPRQTMTVWTCNPGDPTLIDARLTNAGVRLPPFSTGSAIEQMIQRQIGTEVAQLKLAKRYASTTGGPVVSGSYNEIPIGDVVDLFHDDPAASSNANRVAMLWRDSVGYAPGSTGLIDWSASSLDPVTRATDIMVDRLRDSSAFRSGTPSPGSPAPRPALDRRLDLPTLRGPNGEATVINAVRGTDVHRANPDGPFADTPPDWVNYNFGRQIGVALWGNISRKDDATFDSGRSAYKYYSANAPNPGTVSGTGGIYDVVGTPVGALPAKVFEPSAHRLTSYAPFTPSGYLEHQNSVAGDGGALQPDELRLVRDFNAIDGVQYPEMATFNFPAFWLELQNANLMPDIFEGLGAPVLERDTTVALAAPINSSLVTSFGNYDSDNYIRVTMNQTEFRDLLTGRRNLRVGDMLLPLAVGAYRTPLETFGTGPASANGQYSQAVLERLDQYEAQWTTLGEALASAAGYSDSVGPGGGVASGGPKDPFESLSFDHQNAGIPGLPKTEKFVLDRGHLRLDAFVPFIDMDPTDSFTEGIGNFTENVDIRRGLGIPMALAIFDIAQAGSDLGLEAMGSLTRPVVGTVNVNTAEPETLRLHPALAMDMYRASGAIVPDRLWWPRELENMVRNAADFSMNDFKSSDPRKNVAFADVGSTIAAYRDPARYTRLHIGSGGLVGGSNNLTEITAFQRVLVDASNSELGIKIDRQTKSDIEAIRSKQGILSMGELFAARDTTDPDIEHQMGGFALDKRTMGMGVIDTFQSPTTNNNFGRGIQPPIHPADRASREFASFGGPLTGDLIGYAMNYGATTTDPRTFPGYPGLDGEAWMTADNPMLPIMPDQIPDSYDEQLVQLNAVLNSMTVSSDYYAVWYIVHGYKDTDTQGLIATDPLTPSFSARYLMIIDRSNVTRKGDRPKVLAFVQLPMLPAPSTPGSF